MRSLAFVLLFLGISVQMAAQDVPISDMPSDWYFPESTVIARLQVGHGYGLRTPAGDTIYIALRGRPIETGCAAGTIDFQDLALAFAVNSGNRHVFDLPNPGVGKLYDIPLIRLPHGESVEIVELYRRALRCIGPETTIAFLWVNVAPPGTASQ